MKTEYNADYESNIDIDKQNQISTHECPISQVDKNICRPKAKVCNVCLIEKPLTEFYFKKTENTYYYNCKSCGKNSQKKYYKINKEEISVKKKIYHEVNYDIIKERRKNHKIDYNNVKSYYKKRYALDITYKMRVRAARDLNSLVRRGKDNNTIKYLGCNRKFLKEYLESKFKIGIDHIYPLSKINFQDEAQKIKALHYTNLQPLWRNENRQKSNKIEF